MGYGKFIVLLLLSLGVTIECKLQCDYTAYDDSKAWLKYHDEPADWNTARLQCALEGALLAIPTRKSFLIRMKYIARNGPHGVFIGIRKSPFTGNFLTVKDTVLDDIPYEWATDKGEPSHDDGKECVLLNHKGEIEAVDCNKNYPYICYNSYENFKEKCRPGYTLSPNSNSCHKLHHELLTHDEAEAVCVSEGSHLVVINNEYERWAIEVLLNKASNSTYHSRAGFRRVDRKWITVHGKTLKESGYGTFAAGEPNNFGGNEDCGSIQRDIVLYNDIPCNTTNSNFICEQDFNCVDAESNLVIF